MINELKLSMRDDVDNRITIQRDPGVDNCNIVIGEGHDGDGAVSMYFDKKALANLILLLQIFHDQMEKDI
jgi:hypothetical protein